MEIVKEKTVCFTGHRPEKISDIVGGYGPALDAIKSMLYYQIYQAVEEGFDCFISGLARGVDIWAAQFVIELKNKFPDVKLICARPFAEHNKGFTGDALWKLKNILNNADEIVDVSEEYSKNCYRKRNYYMVDNSSRLIAVVDNYRSGTGQTINYAYKKGIDVRIINVKDYAIYEVGEKFQKPSLFRFT